MCVNWGMKFHSLFEAAGFQPGSQTPIWLSMSVETITCDGSENETHKSEPTTSCGPIASTTCSAVRCCRRHHQIEFDLQLQSKPQLACSIALWFVEKYESCGGLAEMLERSTYMDGHCLKGHCLRVTTLSATLCRWIRLRLGRKPVDWRPQDGDLPVEPLGPPTDLCKRRKWVSGRQSLSETTPRKIADMANRVQPETSRPLHVRPFKTASTLQHEIHKRVIHSIYVPSNISFPRI